MTPTKTHAAIKTGRRLLATIAGTATPVLAATHAAMHSGHFGSSTAATPGSALPASFDHLRF